MGKRVVQEWAENLTFMQQSVLIASVRGPDGIKKDHVAKLLLRWLRRCFLVSAFDGKVLDVPYNRYDRQGGSFTGASCEPPPPGAVDGWPTAMDDVVSDYLRCVDELPHHFQLHFMHAAEILGYKHPSPTTRGWWLRTYHRLANDMHLVVESEAAMDKRLGDYERDWLAAEEVTARGPGRAS